MIYHSLRQKNPENPEINTKNVYFKQSSYLSGNGNVFKTLSVAQGLADSPNFSSSKNPRTF